MKSNETKDTSLDISKNKANPNKPVLFTIKSPNNELLNKMYVFAMDIGLNQIMINLSKLSIFTKTIGQEYKCL